MASHSSDRRLWRVYMIHNEDISWTVDGLFPPMMGRTPRHSSEDMNRKFRAYAYRIDYDGRRYAAVPRGFSIPPFEGERDIATLAVYPERFQQDVGALIKSLADQGLLFRSLMGHARQSIKHEGWKLYHDPAGSRLPEPNAPTNMVVSEYISSDVIIDFEEVYHRHPVWKPVFSYCNTNTWSPTVKHDLFAIIQWSDTDRSYQMSKVKEVVIEADDVSELEWNEFSKTDNFIAESKLDPTQSLDNGQSVQQIFGQRDLALLPSRLFVYSLRDRKFFNADLRYLKVPVPPEDPFKELRIPDNHKTMIESMVQDHFDKKKTQRRVQTRGETYLEQDFIPGKGQGLVMLLHGAPGVGKTATAEAVAYVYKRPLFPITCGDLGIDPYTVERSLSDIFRLANLWDCVLLLDEAEILLSQRERLDGSLKRNALVPIFLRTLEYYPGVLFLTTNRVGVLDEALNSRVHMSLFFQYLDRKQTMDLFKMNIQRSIIIAEQRASVTGTPALVIQHQEIMAFAQRGFDDCKRRDQAFSWWNGRQIRNAFQIATSLAYEKAAQEPKYLGYMHFDRVLQAIQHYGEYQQGIHEITDEENAQGRGERRRPEQNFAAHGMPLQQHPIPATPPQQGYTLNQQHFHTDQTRTMLSSEAPRYYGNFGVDRSYQTPGAPSQPPGEPSFGPAHQPIQSSYIPGTPIPPGTSSNPLGNIGPGYNC